jgi:hypothetical protein
MGGPAVTADSQPLDAALAARRADRAFLQRLARRVAEDATILDRLAALASEVTTEGHLHRYPAPNAQGFPPNQCLDCGGWFIAEPDLTPPPEGLEP